MNRSDDILVGDALKGDRQAFGELVRRYSQPLAAMISRHVADRHHAEDVFQESLFHAWQSLRLLRDRSNVKAWLMVIARNRCRDHNKSAKRREKPTDDELLHIYVNQNGRAVIADNNEESPPLIHCVGEKQRETAELFYLKGFTIAQIARELNEPEGTIKSRLHYARESMRTASGVRLHRNRKEKT